MTDKIENASLEEIKVYEEALRLGLLALSDEELDIE